VTREQNNSTVAINLHLGLFDRCCFHIPVRLASLLTARYTAEVGVLHQLEDGKHRKVAELEWLASVYSYRLDSLTGRTLDL
jgi:hypothetical protein